MKAKLVWIIGAAVAIAALATGIIIGINIGRAPEGESEVTTTTDEPKQTENIDKRSVSYNGQLHVDGKSIKNQHDETVQLTGISTHGIQWFGDLYNAQAVAQLKKDFGINVFRIAMYTDPNASGFIANNSLKDKVYELVDAAIKEDIYVIVDWHILHDNNPQTYQSQAINFFKEVTAKYGDTPNVIYEICNEPNSGTNWDSVRAYAEAVTPAIREKAEKALVLVGTPDWSKDLDSAAKAPVSDKNTAYTLHFYSGTHKQELREVITRARKRGLAVFVSECGASDASGDGQLYADEFITWADFMREKNISWTYWSFSNKNEVSAILQADYVPQYGDGFSFDNHLSESGKLLKRALNNKEEK
ncbi:glycoside hydrolase family 5 protein [Candidatus Saccharibacteria bacterium]|nr:glycoside hydrolase family 5 protein [Candidatus Saccharibacteria bacterium]